MTYPAHFAAIPPMSPAESARAAVRDHTPAVAPIESLDDPRAAGLLAHVKRQSAAVHAANEKIDARSEWRDAILNSPEAQARPLAAARLIELSRPNTMPVDQAIATLRGIRPEGGAIAGAATIAPASAAPIDARAARLLEIQALGVHLRAERGDENAKAEVRRQRAGRRS